MFKYLKSVFAQMSFETTRKKILTIIAFGMIMGLAQNAYAVSLSGLTDSLGRQWGNPFDGLRNMAKNDQINAVLTMHPNAIIADTTTVLNIADLDYGDSSMTTNITEMETFIFDLFFTKSGGCISSTRCFSRFSETMTSYGLNSITLFSEAFGDNTLPANQFNNFALLDTFAFSDHGIFWYLPAEVASPSIIALLGAMVIFIASTAYRRRKT